MIPRIQRLHAAGYRNVLHFDAYKRRYSVRPRGTRNGSAALANMFALQAIPCLLIQATGSARINTRVFRGHEQSDLWDPTFFFSFPKRFVIDERCRNRIKVHLSMILVCPGRKTSSHLLPMVTREHIPLLSSLLLSSVLFTHPASKHRLRATALQ